MQRPGVSAVEGKVDGKQRSHCELSGQIANAEWRGVKNERERGE